MNNNLTVNDVASWLEGYREAWETLDPDKAASLFDDNASYRQRPFEQPHRGRVGVRNYWANVTSDQKDVNFTYEVLAVTGNTGIAHWHSEFSYRSTGADIIMDGIFVLEFSDDSLVKDLKKWWHVKVESESGDELNQ